MQLFKKSDVDFLQLLIQAADNALKAAQMLRSAFMGKQNLSEYFSLLKDLEDKGDTITHQIYKGLNNVTVAPLSSHDILELAVRLDNVTDGLEASIAIFDYMVVDKTDRIMRDFSEILVESCEHIRQAIKLLADKKYLQVREHTIKINTLENDGDRLMREGIRAIFSSPKDPYHDFKLKEIYQMLEETTDACEDVANSIESIVSRMTS